MGSRKMLRCNARRHIGTNERPLTSDYGNISTVQGAKGGGVSALSAQAYADRREGVIEADVLRLVRVYAAIHRAEEEIGAIAELQLRIGISSDNLCDGLAILGAITISSTAWAQLALITAYEPRGTLHHPA